MLVAKVVQRTPRLKPSLAVGAVLFAACSTRSELDRVIVRDSAGVAIVESQAPLDGEVQRITVDSIPVVDISGGGEGRADFGARILVTRFSGGPIVVANRREMFWFSKSGSWIRSTGRAGEGPGEFRQIDLLQVFGDSLLVYDLALRRVTVFDSSGQFGRVTNMVGVDSAGPAFPLAVLADGRLLLGSYPRPTPGNGLRRDSVMLRVGSAIGAFTASIGRVPWVEQVIETDARGVSMRRVVYARNAFWGTFGAQVLVATNERFSFDWYDAGGRLLRSIRRKWTPTPVTDADVRAQVDEWLESFPPGAEDRKAKARTVFSAGPRPAYKPPYSAVVVSKSGDVWAQEYGEPGQRGRPSVFSVFDRDGRWRTQASVPPGVTPVAIGTQELLATWRDPDDAVHVRVYRIRHK